MKPTIKNKLAAGFGAVLFLMGTVAAIGIYAVVSLRASALETARVGDRLDSISLEIQVHNLEAQRKIKGYLTEFSQLGAEKARETYLDEAEFEINEIGSLAAKGVKIAPTEDKRAKFQLIADAAVSYAATLEEVVQAAEKDGLAGGNTSIVAYDTAAERLNQSAEDGEMVGRDASQSSLESIERTSKRSVNLVIGISGLGLLLGIVVSYKLARAILVPVEHLKSVAESVSLGEMDVTVHRYSEDEIGDLADSFSRMVTAVKFFRLEAAEANQAHAAEAGGGR
jgi:methyl-accepting chemotaxis protein